jgi:hypothetical protein
MSSPYWPGETPPAPTRPDPPTGTNGLAIASLVLGLVGILTFLFLAIPPTLAVIFGGVALGQIDDPRRHQAGRGLAIAGIALGAVGIVAFLVFVGLAASGVIHDDTAKPVRACASQRAVVDSFDRLTNEVCVPDGPTFAPPPHGYEPDVSLRRALANLGQSGTDPTVPAVEDRDRVGDRRRRLGGVYAARRTRVRGH